MKPMQNAQATHNSTARIKLKARSRFYQSFDILFTLISAPLKITGTRSFLAQIDEQIQNLLYFPIIKTEQT